MNISEKIRKARKSSGYSQEQFAEKLCVSRQAVTKWETGKGIPDIDNLKSISALLNVSIDYLIDDGNDFIQNGIKEKINLADYEIMQKGVYYRQDACVLAKYFNADKIYILTHFKKLSKKEWIADFLMGPGVFQVADQMANINQHYYLVEQGDRQFFVCVDSEFIISTALQENYIAKKFKMGKYIYKRGYALK